mmetsp:Transcript_31018/g.72839  ORF Transcript_31018/g.72839 Transcript_31018/m.72839 type:complete len:150 (-) Transcript_31018:1331-1780(-)
MWSSRYSYAASMVRSRSLRLFVPACSAGAIALCWNDNDTSSKNERLDHRDGTTTSLLRPNSSLMEARPFDQPSHVTIIQANCGRFPSDSGFATRAELDRLLSERKNNNDGKDTTAMTTMMMKVVILRMAPTPTLNGSVSPCTLIGLPSW